MEMNILSSTTPRSEVGSSLSEEQLETARARYVQLKAWDTTRERLNIVRAGRNRFDLVHIANKTTRTTLLFYNTPTYVSAANGALALSDHA